MLLAGGLVLATGLLGVAQAGPLLLDPDFRKHAVTTQDKMAFAVHTADIDGDGDNDLVTSWGDDVVWHENDGEESFTPHVIARTDGPDLHLADLDGDGDTDIFADAASGGEGGECLLPCSRPPSTDLAWFENDGTGSFTWHRISTDNYHIESVFVADVDGDGDLDGLTAGSSQVFWHQNDGTELFSNEEAVGWLRHGKSVTAADIDGDDDTDLLTTSNNAGTVAWHENDGSESFTRHNLTTTRDDPKSAVAGDLDGDGDLDVVSASFWDDTLAWHENREAGFVTHEITRWANGALSVETRDVDGDGDPDILVALHHGDSIAWYENQLDEPFDDFARHKVDTDADGASSVQAGDVDGDGDLDLLGTAYWDNTGVDWYENTLACNPTVCVDTPAAP